MGIRQLPSGACQVRFQQHHISYAATHPTLELAEDAEPLLRAAALAGRSHPLVASNREPSPGCSCVPDPVQPPTPDEVRSSSAAAAETIDTILADVLPEHWEPAAEPDEALTSGQAAVLLGISRPTLIAWLDAGHIPFHRVGSHRRVRRSHVLAFREQSQRSSGRRQPSHEFSPGGGLSNDG
jgi:excisionase family DNA binding protein